MKAKTRDLVGRTIKAVDWRPFKSYDPRGTAHNPILTLDNGRRVWFTTEETESGEYGTSICISPLPESHPRFNAGNFEYGNFRVTVPNRPAYEATMTEGEATQVAGALQELFNVAAEIQYQRPGETEWKRW